MADFLTGGKSAENVAALSKDFVDFLNDAWTPFHTVQKGKEVLLAAGFVEISEANEFAVESGGKYFYTRNMSTLVAFAVGKQFDLTKRAGFTILGAHTDSPCPKLKPISKLSKGACEMVGVECYGGGLWHTWFDRDLTLAGRVIVKTSTGGFDHRLVKFTRPLLRISTLAIHLTNAEERKGFSPNKQEHFMPMLATQVKAKLWQKEEGKEEEKKDGDADAPPPRHSPLLLSLLATELGCAPEDIMDFELQVCDCQPSAIGGALEEFVFSGRLDNLCSSFQSLRALVDSCGSLDDEPHVRMAVLFDHEEIGSQSSQGANSPVSLEAVSRIARAHPSFASPDTGRDWLERALRRSLVVSADMAHAQHPNYPGKHDPALAPKLHGGVVLKNNVNQRYATNAVSGFLFREIGNRAGLPTQEFSVRNDMGCGSTIGPITAGRTGMRVVDVGCPQLSMHSVREMMGTDDVYHGYAHYRAVLETLPQLDDLLKVDAPNL
eukprot:CAMPEP_0113937808 /NCGR_PEP_ID=MMETSP1339-20121228/4343_1 /TAXON_ID=94617 /ORGANISM="Fibrocapsa japonica" /LENGTH=491 /DNA_ID=CAMNT_0000940713 /DNA_START=60 /DNA_END=1535 /DNA_ORIENTATION=- /assembly_acc=CAM_ASM_000762